jgi:hypothetical protein
VKQFLRYVVGTSNWGLCFGRKKRNHALLTGFNDADFGRDVDAMKNASNHAHTPHVWYYFLM